MSRFQDTWPRFRSRCALTLIGVLFTVLARAVSLDLVFRPTWDGKPLEIEALRHE